MSTNELDYTNPYVGPYSFGAEDKLYGRNREVRELLDLLIADRIVLLHSPSGAGKTSLIQAALIPTLRKERFTVLNVVRVGLSVAQRGDNHNSYVLSTLLSLEETVPKEQQIPEEKLAQMTVEDYLTAMFDAGQGKDGVVIIFDQFEEILTLDPIDEEQKLEFFRQLGSALADRRVWALFAMREDFLGALEPYTPEIPTRLLNTYRLDLLGVPAALAASQKPVQARNVTFHDDAARVLIDDLRKVRVQRSGKAVEEFGPHIEPVQLQVVCYRLWSKLVESWKLAQSVATEITKADVEGCANVNQALAGYYADKVKEIAKSASVSERQLRDWFESRLISATGFRGQVLKDDASTGTLSNAVIEELVDAYLIREERRRGLTWFELAHDRLIDPIRQDNIAWREANLTAIQIQALTWKKAHEDSAYVPNTAESLDDALRWFDDHESELIEVEQDFWQACRQARAKLWRKERRRKRKRKEARQKRKQLETARQRRVAIRIAIVALIGLIFTTWLAFKAVTQSRLAQKAQQTAETQTRILTARQIADEALKALDNDPAHGLFLSLLAVGETYQIPLPDKPDAAFDIENIQNHTKDTLSLALNDSQIKHAFNTEVADLVYSPDGNRLMTVGPSGLKIWDAVSGRELEIDKCKLVDPNGKPLGFKALAFSADGKSFALLGAKSVKFLDSVTCSPILDDLWIPENTVNAIAIGSDMSNANLLATGGSDGTVSIYDIKSRTARKSSNKFSQRIQALAFKPAPIGRLPPGPPSTTPLLEAVAELTQSAVAPSPTPPLPEEPQNEFVLAVTDESRVWTITNKTEEVLDQRGGKALAFSPDSKFLVTTIQNLAVIWETKNWRRMKRLEGHTAPINSISFGSNVTGTFLVTASEDKSLVVWAIGKGKSDLAFATLTGHLRGVKRVAFSPNGKQVASATDDGTIRIWLPARTLRSVQDVAISDDGRQIASLGRDGTVNVREADSIQQSTFSASEGNASNFNRIAFDPNTPGNVTVVDDKRATPWVIKGTQPTPFVFQQPNITCIAYAKKGQKIVATGNLSGEVMLWDPLRAAGLSGGARNQLALGHKSRINSLAFSPDGNYLVTANDDGTASLIDVKKQVVTDTLATDENEPLDAEAQAKPNKSSNTTTEQRRLFAVDFDPYGKLVATAGSDKLVRVWQVESGKNVKQFCSPFKGHNHPIKSVAFMALKNKLLLASNDDEELRIWNVSGCEKSLDSPSSSSERQETIATERAFVEGSITALSVGRGPDNDSLRVVTGTAAGEVRVHLLGSGGVDQLLMQARRRATKSWLQADECPTAFGKVCRKAQDALKLVIQGNELARAGQVKEAIAQYEEANKLNYAALKINNTQEEAEQLAEEGHRERGDNYAEHKSWENAINEYRKLTDWRNLFDAAQTLANRGTYKKSTGQEVTLVSEAIELHRLGEQAFSRAKVTEDDRNARAKNNNFLCWFGSWWRDPNVSQACDDVAARAHSDPAYKDTEAVYRALAFECTGKETERTKAIENLEFYADWTSNTEEEDERHVWISKLKSGQTIFTRENVQKQVGQPISPSQMKLITSQCKK